MSVNYLSNDRWATIKVLALALESQTSINKLEASSAYQQSLKCIKTSKKINFIKIVFVSISINRDVSIYTYRNEHFLYKIDFFDVFMHFELC